MKPVKTYRYIQDGHSEGPYFEQQIVKMTESGLIRADAEIECVETKAKGGLGAFLVSIEENLKKDTGVVVKDINMGFGSMIIFIIKWVLASIPAAIILFILFAIFTALFGGMLGGLFYSLFDRY